MNDALGLGGVNLEGNEYTFGPYSRDDFGTQYGAACGHAPNGRPIRVKLVRNRSDIYLKGGLLAYHDEGDVFTFGTNTVGASTRKPGWGPLTPSFPRLAACRSARLS